MSHHVSEAVKSPVNDLLSLMGIGIWEWEPATGKVDYNTAWIQIAGLPIESPGLSVEDCKAMIHPDDLPHFTLLLENCLSGRIPEYTCQMRIRHSNGCYTWIQDVGKVAEWDTAGNPVRLTSGRQNINSLKHLEKQLSEVLENNHISMKNASEIHSLEMAEQSKLLWTISQMSRRLLIVQSNENFENMVQDCLSLLGESTGKSRVYIWKDRTDSAGRNCCSQIYEWVRGAKSIQGSKQFEEIPYDSLPAFDAAINGDRCLNSLMRNLSDSERRILSPQDIKTILIAPIAISGNRWGFIGMDNCEDELLFTSVEENLLMMSGSMLANTIEKIENEAALREMEERTQIMLNATPLCCNLWTPTFQNMSCNEEAVRLFELSSQEEYLERFYELSPEYQPCKRLSSEMALEWVTRAFDQGYCRFEWLHQKLDGTPIPAEITLVRIKYKNSYIVAGYTRDLREQKAMLAEQKTKEVLRRARDQALLSSQAKSNFLANMSHEIRTPINAISGFADIIMRQSIDEKTTEYAKGIKSASNSLINIINDILDISKIESGKLEIFSSPYELASLLNDAITISRMRLGSKPLMFITDIDSHLPARLVGDEVRIKQILLNMLSNAIKYTHEGYIKLRVSGAVAGNQATLRFSVKDSGIGIKPEDLSRLFEEFERVNTTKNRSVEGTGLGLAISKQLCEMMGGTIMVESTYEKGSEFTVVIPQECPSYEWLAQVKQKKSVLLYEPREHYRLSIAETLKNLECKCISSSNQSELYHNIVRMPYDYILTAALYLKKVQAMIQKYMLPLTIAVFADYGETIDDDNVYTILFPVNCLQLSALLNGHHEEDKISRRNAASIKFSAPAARVLVVDDNPVNLKVAEGLMEPYQFVIDTARNGVQAVKMVKDTEYDLVFMDHMMPEMDGVDATIAIRNLEGEKYRNLPIIALTANALVGTREMFIREGMNDFLAKPIEINKLAHILLKWLPQSKVKMSLSQDPVIAEENIHEWDIAGINTAQGILSVGGSKENYLQILSAYHADGLQKCSSLMQHISKNDFAAFRTEIHAVKSTSATIGAMEISAMAAKLEEAARNNDIMYINYNFNHFLIRFQAVLEAAWPILHGSQIQEFSAERQTPGDINYLKETLDLLLAAAEMVHINLIEENLSKLQQFTWPEKITAVIQTMQKHLNVFNYDGILECGTRLKETLEL